MAVAIKDKFAKKVYLSDFSAEVGVDILNEFKLSRKKRMQAASIIDDVFLKKIKIQDLHKELSKRLKISSTKGKDLAKEIAGRKFLVVDQYFGGQVSQYLRDLGATPEQYAKAVELFKKKLDEEEAMLKEAPEEELEIPAEKIKVPERPVLGDPEKEAKDIGSIFDNQLVDTFKWADFRAKADLNMLIMTLLLRKGEFQQTLMQKITNNQEKLTKEQIEIANQTVDPTISNWLKDFISVVGVEGTVTSIQKARYVAESKNAQKLDKEEEILLDMLLDTYVAIRNFFTDIERRNIADMAIFPFTEKDAEAMREYVKETQKKEEKEPEPPPKDIFELYMGNKEDQAMTEKIKEDLEKSTAGDVKKAADELEEGFLKKDKFKTIAALMLLVEKGGFIDLLKEDIRYRDYLTSYLNRIGKANLVDNFVVNPTQPQFVVYLLKYVLEERVGLSEEEAARIATHFDTIYTKRGQEQYSKLAYYDLKEKKFKWQQ